MPHRHFGNRAAVFQYCRKQLLMLGRIDAVVAASKHCDGAARHTCPMRRLIDSPCQSLRYYETGFTEIVRQRLREL